MTAIYFNANSKEYKWLSNMAVCFMEIEGEAWKTVEHFFQSMKFTDPVLRERIRQLDSPFEAKTAGRVRHPSFVKDWNVKRTTVMYMACRTKFNIPEFRELLVNTAGYELLEDSNDNFWGIGSNGKGKNMLGVTLMKIRETLLEEDYLIRNGEFYSGKEGLEAWDEES